MTEHGEPPLCPVWEEAKAAELLCCLAQAYLGRAKHPGQIFLRWWLEGDGQLVVSGQFPSWGMVCWSVLVGLDHVGWWCLGDISFCLLRMCWGEEGLSRCTLCSEAGPHGHWCVSTGRSILGQLWWL